MQCWGDASTGPSPEQCQWGAPSPTISSLMGVNTAKRDLALYDDPLQDPALAGDSANPDFLLPAPIENPFLHAYRMPFRSVDGSLAKTTVELSKVFDASTTNEVSAARTGRDGSGQVTFETQTSLEAPQLGCGADEKTASGTVVPRSCWLVIVPRGSHNLDGSPSTDTASGRIAGSPLSASAWRNRVVVPLGFQSVSQSCPFGNAEQRIVGSEPISEAVTSWQPALCRLGTTYGYSKIGDGEAKRQIVSTVSGASRLAVVDSPLDATLSSGTSIAYAPVAQSSIVVAFNIDYRLYPDAPGVAKNGQQATELTLNARLVAKLLTQSYQADVPGGGTHDKVVSANPRSILTDPEFLQLNPSFTGSTSDGAPAGLMVALGSSDANARVWDWIRADPVADGFLAGKADDWGMRVNPNYAPLSLATDPTIDSFPKADLTIAKGGDSEETGYGTLDMRPYMNDMHEGAYRTLKADPNERDSWNPFGQPKGYISLGAQVPGARFVLSITDSASAARYGLPTAKLVNAAGQAVASTPTTVLAAVAAMKPSAVQGVLQDDANQRTLDAYPLAMVSYAAVNVCASTPKELADYAKLIDYGTHAGQASGDARGQLPRGYVPLDKASVVRATTTAQKLTDKAAVASACPKAPTAPSSPTSSGGSSSGTGSTSSGFGSLGTTPVDSGSTVGTAPGSNPVAVAQDADETGGLTGKTTDSPLATSRLALAGALGVGLPALGAGPLLIRRGRRLARLALL